MKGKTIRTTISEADSRRRFLRLLAASPVLAASGFSYASRETIEQIAQGEGLITAPEQAVNMLEFEAVARQNLPPAHFGYLATGTDDDGTIQANREGFGKYQLRVRRLRDIAKIDLSLRLFGTTYDNPILIAPVGSQKAFHPEGELAVAKAARAKKHLHILSTHSSVSLEAIHEAQGVPAWFQLYPTNDWNVTKALVKRAETAGCPVIALTVDAQGGSKRETLARLRRTDTRTCTNCHLPGGYNGLIKPKPMFQGIDISKVTTQIPLDMNWDIVKRLKDTMKVKLLLKGIVTREDAQLAVEHGADGIIVSNHGGRAEASNRGTIESLPEVISGAAGKIPVLIDGGFRRGTDIFKALALGANAICVWRPYLWGLAAFGQPGVEAVLEILRRELLMTMRQAGTISVEKITREYLIER